MIMFSVILKDWHAVASWMHSVETGKFVSLGRPKGYEDWLKVDCGIPEHKEVDKKLGSRKCQKQLKKTYQRNLHKLSRKQKMLEGLRKTPAESSKTFLASPEAETVEQTQENTMAESSEASPEAGNVERLKETYQWNLHKLARKQEILK